MMNVTANEMIPIRAKRVGPIPPVGYVPFSIEISTCKYRKDPIKTLEAPRAMKSNERTL